MIVSICQTLGQNQTNNLRIHFVFASHYYYFNENKLRSFILAGLKKYKIRSVMVTIIGMWRLNLITKEAMESYCKGADPARKGSVNDDLDSLFEDLQLGKEPDDYVQFYHLPKLTAEELRLVDNKDPNYRKTFKFSMIDEVEFKQSDSKSKFVKGHGRRLTFSIRNSEMTDSDVTEQKSYNFRKRTRTWTITDQSDSDSNID